MDENKKEHHLHIVLTTQQYQLLCCQAKECRLTKRAYLARLIEGRPVKARPTKEIKELRTEIHHIGNNINQIARSVNAGIAKPEDAKRGLYLLDQVYELIYDAGAVPMGGRQILDLAGAIDSLGVPVGARGQDTNV